jgi:hypothetical protein
MDTNESMKTIPGALIHKIYISPDYNTSFLKSIITQNPPSTKTLRKSQSLILWQLTCFRLNVSPNMNIHFGRPSPNPKISPDSRQHHFDQSESRSNKD